MPAIRQAGGLALTTTADNNVSVSLATGAGSNRLLIVAVKPTGDNATVTNVAFSGAAMTLIGTVSTGTGWGTMTLYALEAPASGTANLTMTLGSFGNARVFWASYSDTTPGAAYGTAFTNTGTSTAPSSGSQTCPAGALLFAAFIQNAVFLTPTATAGTLIGAAFDGGTNRGFGAAERNTTGAITFGTDFASPWAVAGVAVLGDSAIPAPTLTSPTTTTTSATATGGFSTTGTDGTARAVWIESATAPTAPTATQVLAGQNAAGTTVASSAVLTVTGSGVQTLAAATVTAGLTYWGFAAHVNAAAAASSVLSLGRVFPGTGRPTSDIAANSYTASAGSVLADLLNENAAVADGTKDATFITSAALTGSFNTGPVMALNKSYPAGTYSAVRVRKWVDTGAGEFRVNFLNDAGTLMGQTAVQAMTTTPTTYTLAVTLTGPATRVQIIERTV